MSPPIYLDHFATTPPDPRVVDAVLPYLREHFGNASSRTHEYGWRAAEAVSEARARLGRWLDCPAERIVFTSGATEANNLALRGICRPAGITRVVSQPTEHRAVLDVLATLERPVHWLPVDGFGRVDPEDLDPSELGPDVLVTIMAANNETGSLQPLAEIARRCRETGAWFHVDAAQWAGRLPLSFRDLALDFCSVSAHKCHGLLGCGALLTSERAERTLEPLLHGGGQERGLRAGTANVPAIVGFGVAASLALQEGAAERERVGARRDRFEALLIEQVGAESNGHPSERLPQAAHLTFPGQDAALILLATPDVAASLGSACRQDGSDSHVLQAMGFDPARIRASIRFSLGRFTTEEDVERAAAALVAGVTAAADGTRVSGR